MATSIGPKIGVAGYDEFKFQMDTIVSKLKALDAEAATLEKAYQGHTDSLEYLTKKSEIYSKQLELQRQRVEEATKWEEKVTAYVNQKEQATNRDSAAVAKAQELTARYNSELQITELNVKQTSEEIDNYADNLLEAADNAEISGERSTAAAVAVGNIITQLIDKTVELGKRALETGLKFNASMESYKASFTTLLGSTSASEKALNDILKNAVEAPTFSVDALADANRSLIASGKSAEEANKAVMSLATALAAAGQSDDALRRMATNLQQIANNGRAYQIDIRQFGNVGINIYKLLSDYTGQTITKNSELEVSYDMLVNSLVKAASEGGMFYGALETQAQTLSGQINALKNNLNKGLGEAFEGITNTLESKLLPALNRFLSSDNGIENLVAGVEGLIISLGILGTTAKLSAFTASDGFSKAAMKVSLYNLAVKEGRKTQEEFTAAMSLSDIVIGVMSGEMTIAEAATWAWSTALSALPFVAVAAAIGVVISQAKKGAKQYQEYVDSLVPVGDTAEEVSAQLEELYERQKQLEEDLQNAGAEGTYMLEEEYSAVTDAIRKAEEELQNLVEAEKAAMEAANDPEAQLNNTIETAKTKIQELYAAYDEAYSAALEAAQKEFDLFEYVEGVSYTSVQDMIKALDSQTLYWENYAANLAIVRDINYGLSQDLIAFLSDGSAESAGYLQSIINDVNDAGGATSEAGQRIIQDINTSFSNLQQAQKNYADDAAETATNFESELNNTIDTMTEDLNKLDITDKMRENAIKDMNAFLDGITSQSDLLSGQAYQIGQAISASMQSGINSIRVSLPTFGNTFLSGKVGKFATGLDYVPYDDFPAYLHKGEMVLTAAQAAQYRNGDVSSTNNTTNYGGVVMNVYGAEGQDVNELADVIAYKLQSAVERRERAGN